MRLIVILFSTTFLLIGCAIKMPQTAQEFRDVAPTAYSIKRESFSVQRPFKAVIEQFRKYHEPCLRVSVTHTSSKSLLMKYSAPMTIIYDYTPKLNIYKDTAELTVQYKFKGVVNVHRKPLDGYYMLVVDIKKAGENTTHISMVRPTFGFHTLTRAVKGWAEGTVAGCPDLSK